MSKERIEDLEQSIPLRKKTKEEQKEWDVSVVLDYFVHKKPLKWVMDTYGISSKQTLYNARNRVNKLIEESKRNDRN